MQRFLPTTLGLGLALAASLPAQRRPIEDCFPADSFAFVSFAGLGACRAQAERTGLYRLGARTLERAGEARVHALMGRELERALPRLEQHLRRHGLDSAFLRAALQGPIGVGFGRPTVFGEAVMPSIAIACKVGDREGALRRRLEAQLGQLVEHQRGLETSKRELGGHAVTILHSRRHPGSLSLSFAKGFLLVANSEGYLGACLATLDGKTASLRSSPLARNGRDQLGTPPLVSGFLQPGALLGGFAALIPYEVRDIGKSLGVDGFDGVWYGAASDGGSRELTWIGVPGSTKGLLKSAFVRPAKLDAARLCPPDTMFFASAAIDVQAFVASVKRFAGALPVWMRRELDREFLREFERELGRAGMSFGGLEAMLADFGPEVSIAVTTPGGREVIPQALFFVDCKNEAQVEGLILRGLPGRVRQSLRTREVAGHRMHSFSLHKRGIPVAPGFAFVDGKLVGSLRWQYLKRLLQKAEKGSLADDPGFKKAARSARGGSVFAVLRPGPAIDEWWDRGVSLLSVAIETAGDHEFESEILPSADEVREAIGDFTMSVAVDEHGTRIREAGPVGPGAYVAIAGALIDHFLGKASGVTKPAKPRKKIY